MIEDRKQTRRKARTPTGSWRRSGPYSKKIGEEAGEVIIAGKNEDSAEIAYEAADLIYHLFVLLSSQGMAPADVYAQLRKRR